MKRRFILSDHHMGQDSIYSFTDNSGQLLRPWAKSAAEADEMMIEAHNKQVRQQDTTYFLGDVSMSAKLLVNLDRMNGRKVLIRGNHDIFPMKKYTPHFADIRGTHKLGRLILSHYPLHSKSIPRWCKANVHGHTHANFVMRRVWWGAMRPDPRYINACVEKFGITPIDVEEILAKIG
jgi:calcineurin-like phosphoesterase family protein